MIKKILLVILVSCFCNGFLLFGVGIDQFISENSTKLWELTPEEITKNFPNFKFTDKSKKQLRYNMRESKQKVTMFEDWLVPEIIFYFQADKLNEIFISIYNRGDYSGISDTKINLLKDKSNEFIKTFCQDSPVSDRRKIEQNVIESWKFNDEKNDYVLKLGTTSGYTDYYTLNISPLGESKSLKDSLKTSVGKGELQLNVQYDDDGTMFLDIPMVDQGQKGYCVASTLERILKYYNSQIDQHILAQILASEATIGTNIKTAIKILEENRSKLRIRFRVLIEDDNFNNYSDFERLTGEYNNIAKRQKRETLQFNDYVTRIKSKKLLRTFELFSKYEYGIFRDVRTKSASKLNSFAREIERSVANGIPLAWATFVFESTEAEAKIGKISLHMRIINGINPKTREIIYTDSWGEGHEKKRMSYEDAWAITLYLIQISPTMSQNK